MQGPNSRRFDEIGRDSQFVRPPLVPLLGRGGEHGDRQVPERVVVPNAGEDIEPQHIRELEIEKNNPRQRMHAAPSEWPFAIQIVQRRPPIGYHHGVFPGRRFSQGAAKEVEVVFIVFDDQDGSSAIHGALGNSTQKVLPLTPSDTTPAEPFMRSAALRTMARPTPVPS